MLPPPPPAERKQAETGAGRSQVLLQTGYRTTPRSLSPPGVCDCCQIDRRLVVLTPLPPLCGLMCVVKVMGSLVVLFHSSGPCALHAPRLISSSGPTDRPAAESNSNLLTATTLPRICITSLTTPCTCHDNSCIISGCESVACRFL